MWPCKNCILYHVVNLYGVKKDDSLVLGVRKTWQNQEEDGCELGLTGNTEQAEGKQGKDEDLTGFDGCE